MSRQINWDELDKPRYYRNGMLVFLGIRFIIYPTVFVKTRLQVQIGKDVYSGTLDAFKKIYRSEGFTGFYKGFSLFALSIIWGQVYITFFEYTKHRCKRFSPLVQGSIAGAVGSIASQTVSVPGDVVTQKLMVQDMSKKPFTTVKKTGNIRYIVRKIWRKEGFLGFYRGYTISLMASMPNSAIWWGSYNYLLEGSVEYFEADELGRNRLHVQAGCGVISGLLSAAITNTLDVIRTRIQVGGSRSSLKVVKKLWAEERWGIFYKGLTARMMQMSANSLFIVIGYETVKKMSMKKDKVKY